MLQSISGTPAAVLSLTFELINKIEGEMCTSKPRTVLTTTVTESHRDGD